MQAINQLEPHLQSISDEELQSQTAKFRERLAAGETLDDILVEAFAACRESGRRYLGDAALRCPVDWRHGVAQRHDCRNGDGRRQDAGGDAGRVSQRAGGQGRPRGDGQRLPGPPRHGMDGAAVYGVGPDRRRDPVGHGRGGSPEGLFLRHHLRHEQRVRFRLSARQHASGPTRRRSLSQVSPAVAGSPALRHHRRSRQHSDRRSPHAVDHLRPGTRKRAQVCRGRSHRAPVEERRALRGEREGPQHESDGRRGAGGREAGGRRELLHGRATWNGRT